MKFEVSAIKTLEDFMESMMEMAVDLGIEREHVTLTNTQQKIKKVVKEHKQMQDIAKELGYPSIAYALRTLRQRG